MTLKSSTALSSTHIPGKHNRSDVARRAVELYGEPDGKTVILGICGSSNALGSAGEHSAEMDWFNAESDRIRKRRILVDRGSSNLVSAKQITSNQPLSIL